ncbi:MAG TPA: hypothetical protein VL133_13580 [Devosia sp.]|nr:hypothetical protein [Devosia sp.]
MSAFETHHDLVPPGWVQHLPWLGLFTFVLSLLRDSGDTVSDGRDSLLG